MITTWDARVDSFWESADANEPQSALEAMRQLVEERSDTDPEALYEWDSVHDFLGREAEAIPMYRAALDAGLAGDREPQAIIQLASSLRNIGQPSAAIALLEGFPSDSITGSAAQAFLALALHDERRADEALRIALLALAPTLPRYNRAVTSYANDLTESTSTR